MTYPRNSGETLWTTELCFAPSSTTVGSWGDWLNFSQSPVRTPQFRVTAVTETGLKLPLPFCCPANPPGHVIRRIRWRICRIGRNWTRVILQQRLKSPAIHGFWGLLTKAIEVYSKKAHPESHHQTQRKDCPLLAGYWHDRLY